MFSDFPPPNTDNNSPASFYHNDLYPRNIMVFHCLHAALFTTYFGTSRSSTTAPRPRLHLAGPHLRSVYGGIIYFSGTGFLV